MKYEEYRLTLTLTHYMVDEKGGEFPIDEPITVKRVFQRTGTMTSTVLVKNLLDEMGRYVLKFLCEQEEQNA